MALSVSGMRWHFPASKMRFIGYNAAASQDSPHPQHKEDCMGAMKEFAGVYDREGALDPKTMQLVAMAAMAAAGCTS
jgi:alkylhydroperoxidase/carboxymuconolactone decarboxylase family protein YurZ